jgi:hypothetical protein
MLITDSKLRLPLHRRFALLMLFLQLISLAPPAWALGPPPPQEVGRHRATIETVTGAVEIQRAGETEWSAALPGLDLQVGDHLRTDAAGSARVKIGDVGIVELTPATEIRFKNLQQVRALLRAYLVLTRMVNRDDVEIELIRGETRQAFIEHAGRTANYRITSTEGECEFKAATFSTRVEEGAVEAAAPTSSPSAPAVSAIPSVADDADAAFSRADPLRVSGNGLSVIPLHGMLTQYFLAQALSQSVQSVVPPITPALQQAAVSVVSPVAGVAAQLATGLVSAAPTKLSVSAGRGATAGENFSALYCWVKFLDAAGNAVEVPSSAPRTLTVTLVSGPAGATLKGTTSGSVTQAARDEVRNLPAFYVEKPGSYRLRFSSPGLTDAEATFEVKPGSATQLRMLRQPVAGGAGLEFTTAPQVELVDRFGNRATSGRFRQVAVSIASGNGTLSSRGGTVHAEMADDGIATFDRLAIDKAGAFTLKFDFEDDPKSPVTSNSFTVGAGPVITSLTPSSGGPGSTVTAAGTGFTDRSTLTFGTTSVELSEVTATSFKFVAPLGAGQGAASVVLKRGTAVAPAVTFTVRGAAVAPTISRLEPTTARPGASITLVGTGIADQTTVTVGNVADHLAARRGQLDIHDPGRPGGRHDASSRE